MPTIGQEIAATLSQQLLRKHISRAFRQVRASKSRYDRQLGVTGSMQAEQVAVAVPCRGTAPELCAVDAGYWESTRITT